MFEGPPGAHELHDHQPDLVPMNEDERAFLQWQQHQQQQGALQLPMPGHHHEAVPALPDVAPAGGAAAAAVKVLPALASAVTLEKAQKLVPVGKPVMLIREVSHQQLLDMVNSSQRVLEKSMSWELLIERLTWLLFVAALAILVGLAVSFVWGKRSARSSPAPKLAPLRVRR